MRLARLTQRKDFLAAAEHGRRFRSPAFTAQVLDKPAQEGLRLGLTASRKTGNAVVRNRIRRRLRAAAALALAEQTGKPCDLVIVARAETVNAAFRAMVDDIAVALDRARPSGGKRRPDRRPSPRQAS
ncbi:MULTISPECIES: ribonuclease P protein component [unclassified Bosea (in: a-proteobacteria)]|uniref:ribonuclease P protein component n=1 Tax=unclassified Bosea (in: a-proteobacteria) TaxID=2653178 RepID=UPI000F74D1AB|nr:MULTISPECIES: ribonuclease P protein component [unclassified Bosea (in: a-proteobacteria)]AZO79438.1 ribonuclease P protein component [Bosea sp. Tri-49]RXT16325.1 ribonuclease P protein component [Bosea sp. Tri-39]RXT40019.1 ribonuclease P protein component [Bosea sp. Tri-54]